MSWEMKLVAYFLVREAMYLSKVKKEKPNYKMAYPSIQLDFFYWNVLNWLFIAFVCIKINDGTFWKTNIIKHLKYIKPKKHTIQ